METEKSQQTQRPPFMADLERSFFKSWALRSSEHARLVDTSEPSTPISPMTPLNRRSTKRSAPSSTQSEGLNASKDPQEDEPTALIPKRPLLSTISGGLPFLKVTRPSKAGLNDSNDSGSSSVSSSAQKTLPRSKTRSGSDSIGNAEPPRVARLGYRWKRELSGHWLEIRSRGKRQSDLKSLTDFKDAFLDVTKSPRISGTSRASEVAPRGSPTLSEAGISLDTTAHQRSDQTRGLYSRARRRLRLCQEPSASPNSNVRVKTFTGEFLERVTTVLRDMTDRQWTPSPTSSTTSGSMKSSKSIAGWYTGRTHLLPFEDKNSNTHELGHIGTSDEKPHPSPELQSMYTASDSRQYFRVDITSPDGPTYLPSEARRIRTPPLADSNSGRVLRGFFIDHNGQTEPSMEPSSETVKNSPIVRGQQGGDRSSEVDWYRVQMAASETIDAQQRHQFELNVPEHLPNSPLCPKNPKHPSGGKGVCLYHGRNRSAFLTG